jgi:hypothetical protein
MLQAAVSLACNFSRQRSRCVPKFRAFDGANPDAVRISELGSWSNAIDLWHKLMTSSPFKGESISSISTHEIYECCMQDEFGVGHISPIQSSANTSVRVSSRFTQDELSPDHIGWVMRQALHYDIEPGVSRKCEAPGCGAEWATRWAYTANQGPQILTFEFECNNPDTAYGQRKRIIPPPVLNIGNAFWREMNGPAHSKYELHCVIFCDSSSSCRYSVATVAWGNNPYSFTGCGPRNIDGAIDSMHSKWAPNTFAPCLVCRGAGDVVSGDWVIDTEPFGPEGATVWGDEATQHPTRASDVHRGSWQDVLHKLSKQTYIAVYTRYSVQLPVAPRPMSTVFSTLRNHVQLYKRAVQHTLHTSILSVAASFQSGATLSSRRGCPAATQTQIVDFETYDSGDHTTCPDYCDPNCKDCEFKHFGWKRCKCPRCIPLYNMRRPEAVGAVSDPNVARTSKRKRLREISQQFQPPKFEESWLAATTQDECDHEDDECDRLCECACLQCREYQRMSGYIVLI